MASIKLSIHPLFFIFGLYYALTGRIFLFLICTLIALLHEAGHSFVAEKLGYKLNKITLMPFGAIISGNLQGLKIKDQIKIAIAGPLVNLILIILCVALWWFFPVTYPYTEEIVNSSLSLFLINLLPFFPLDGGRIFLSLLCMQTNERRAEKSAKIITILASVFMLILFINTCFKKVNFSLLFFALFIGFSALSKDKENSYVKTQLNFCEGNLLYGMEIKRQAVSVNTPLNKLINILEPSKLNEITVYKGEEILTTLTQGQIAKIVMENDIYKTIGEVL